MLGTMSCFRGAYLGALACLTLATGTAAAGAEYFVAPQGDDAAPGSAAQPWRSLAKVNAMVAAGDAVTFAPGEYDGTLAPEKSGVKGQPIVLRAAPALKAVLRGVKGGPAIVLRERQHIILDGLHVQPAAGWWAVIEKCEEITVRNCRFEDSRLTYTAFAVTGCKRVRILDNVFTRQLLLRNNLVLHGDMLTLQRCDRCVVQGNDFSKAGHGPASWLVTTNDVIRRNVFHAEWGRLFSLFNCTPCLFEENLCLENYHGSGSADAGSKILVIDGIVRRNLVVRNRDYVVHSYSYKYPGYPDWVLQNTRIYHNTFAYNAGHAWGLSAQRDHPEYIAGNIWQNNIFHRNSLAGGSAAFRIDNAIGADNRWLTNLISGDTPGQPTILQWDEGKRQMLALDVAAAQTQYAARFAGNLDASPAFTDPENDVYTLQPDSPCLDRGAPLARIAESANGTELRVDDARWFYDGFGIEGEQGDLIMIGAGKQQARVLSVDRAAKRLVVDRAVVCAQGDPVSLPYASLAPDLGAIESGADGSDWFRPLTLPPGLRRRPPTDPSAPLLTIDFEDADLGDWAYLWYWGRFDIPGTHVSAERVPAEGRPGSCVRLHAEQDNVALEASLKPIGWDLDRYPWVRFAYRIPAGVPVTAGVYALPAAGATAERPATLAISPAAVPAGKPEEAATRLLDDGQWHEVTLDARAIRSTYPDVKVVYAFRFRSPAKYQRGQEFWFTQFAILPAGAGSTQAGETAKP